MKSRLFAMLSSLTLLTAGVALAQNGRTMLAHIPFEYRVGEKVMPAGQYEVRVGVSSGIVSIRNSQAAAMITSSAVTINAAAPETSKLIFKRHGKNYFVATISGYEHGLGRELKAPKAGSEWAVNSVPDAIVEVALATK